MERSELHIKQFSELKVPYDRINLKTKSNHLLKKHTEGLQSHYLTLSYVIGFTTVKSFALLLICEDFLNLIKYYNENEIIT